jgi:hypothetical protein
LIFNFFKLMAFFQTTLTSSHFVIRTVVKWYKTFSYCLSHSKLL